MGGDFAHFFLDGHCEIFLIGKCWYYWLTFSLFMYILHFRSFLVKKIYPGASRGGLNVNLGLFLAIFEMGFWALITKYFKIEKTSENKKVPPWWGDGGVSPQIWPRTNPRVSRAKKPHFHSVNYRTFQVLFSACRYAAYCIHTACRQHYTVQICSIWPNYDISFQFWPRMTSV